MASRVHYSKAHLSKVERGLKAPSRELARLCDAALTARGMLASLARGKGNSPGEAPPKAPGGRAWLMQVSENGESEVRSATRRQVMLAGLASFSSASAASRVASRETNDPAIPAIFRTIFDNYRQLGQVSDPRFLIHPLVAQNHLLQELAKEAGTHNRKKMLAISSRYAEYTGWLFQESGDDQSALWWTGQAVSLARAGGDPGFASYGLVRRALVTMYQGDPEQTTQLAQRAQQLSPSPRISGLAALHEAQGYALAGDHGPAMRILDRAEELLSQANEDETQPVIGTRNVSSPAEMVRGWCLYDLGRPAAAERILGEQLARVPQQARRTHARYGARRALACAAANAIDEACDITSGLLCGNTVPPSATIAKDLHALSRVLTRHPKNPAVRDLMPRLAAATTS